MIRKPDLENHNKDGGLWVVIQGKVYDIHDYREQQTGSEHQDVLQDVGRYRSVLKDTGTIVILFLTITNYLFR